MGVEGGLPEMPSVVDASHGAPSAADIGRPLILSVRNRYKTSSGPC